MVERKRKPGRPPGAKNKKPKGVRFTPTVKKDTLEWINDQPESQGKVIDRLVKDKVKGDK